MQAQVSDEESSQFRCVNYLAAKNLRICPIPDASHPKWGDFGRAIDSSGLRLSLLKGTCLVNHGRGPWGTHRFAYEAQEAASHLLRSKDDEYFEELLPRLEYDLGVTLEDDEDSVATIKGMWAEGVRARLKEAT